MDTSNVVKPTENYFYIEILVTIAYITIFLSALLGNIIICIVLRRNKSMHTPTSVYLSSIATSDILLVIAGIPLRIYSILIKGPYNFGTVFCVLCGLVEETLANASVLMITLFSIERFVFIHKPFLAHRTSTVSRARKNVLILWAVSLSLAVLQALQLRIVTYGGVSMCLVTRTPIEYALEICTVITYFVPAMIITVCYTLIGLKLYKMNKSQNSVDNNNELRRHIMQPLPIQNKRSNAQSTKKEIKILILAVGTFMVSWTPYHAHKLIANYGSPDDHLAQSQIYNSISGLFLYMSTIINMVVYHVPSDKFRDAFKATILERYWPNTGQPVQQQYCSTVIVPMSRNANCDGSANSDKIIELLHEWYLKYVVNACESLDIDEPHPIMLQPYCTANGKSKKEKHEGLKTFKSCPKKQDGGKVSLTRDKNIFGRIMTTSDASTRDLGHRNNIQETYV